jgi:hypothetical protein
MDNNTDITVEHNWFLYYYKPRCYNKQTRSAASTVWQFIAQAKLIQTPATRPDL